MPTYVSGLRNSRILTHFKYRAVTSVVKVCATGELEKYTNAVESPSEEKISWEDVVRQRVGIAYKT